MIKQALNQLKWKRQRWLELQDLKQRELNESTPNSPEMLSGHKCGPVWLIPVPGFQPVYMCLESPFSNNIVVHVRASTFHRAWFALHTDARLPCPRRIAMQRDYKYKHAEEGFSQGYNNPVPLPTLTARHYRKKTLINFMDGYTRTIWLLAHEVAAFPVLCYSEIEANCLYELAGLEPPIHLNAQNING